MRFTLVLGKLILLYLNVQNLIVVEGISLSCASGFVTGIDLGQGTANISLLCFVSVRNEDNNVPTLQKGALMSFAFMKHYEIPRQGVLEGLTCCRNLKVRFHLAFRRFLPGLQ